MSNRWTLGRRLGASNQIRVLARAMLGALPASCVGALQAPVATAELRVDLLPAARTNVICGMAVTHLKWPPLPLVGLALGLKNDSNDLEKKA